MAARPSARPVLAPARVPRPRLRAFAAALRRLLRAPARRWLPRRSVRLRLTALYGSLFLVAGALLLTITYLLVASNISGGSVTVTSGNSRITIYTGSKPSVQAAGFSASGPGSVLDPTSVVTKVRGLARGGGNTVRVITPTNFQGPASAKGTTLPLLASLKPNGILGPAGLTKSGQRLLSSAVAGVRSNELGQLLLWSGTALGIMALMSVALGWLMAGRVLAPLRTMTAAARQISAENLYERLTVDGPDDELKELGDTFDGLLARLEAAFEAQRRFVANASHELRTPLTLERTMIEVALADPAADAQSLRAVCARVLAAGEQQERMLEAMLTLARGERGLDRRDPLDLAAIADDVLLASATEAQRRGLRIHATTARAPASGDAHLVERLVANLVDNALRHNVADGRVEVVTETRAGQAVFSVANTGPSVPPREVQRLIQPFQRLAPDRTAHGDGLGLGLSIVHAIAKAHGATLTARARAGGGLHVEVCFPLVDMPSNGGAPQPLAWRRALAANAAASSAA